MSKKPVYHNETARFLQAFYAESKISAAISFSFFPSCLIHTHCVIAPKEPPSWLLPEASTFERLRHPWEKQT